jgi:hypothetical protein
MAEWRNCLTCELISPLKSNASQEEREKCPACGGTNVKTVSQEQFTEGFEAGTYFNIDPKRGKRAKKKRR